MFDEELFFARRLGFGLRSDEHISGSVTDWAVAQLQTIPLLDFYGPDGKPVPLASLPAQAAAMPTTMEEALHVWELKETAETTLQKDGRNLSGQAYDMRYYKEVGFPYDDVPRWRDYLVRTMTAVNGPSPVFERFWHFWCNHFTVSSAENNIKVMCGAHTRTLRSHMTGKFTHMLVDAIVNPAMLIYLDNVDSTGPHSQFGREESGNINENLARELFELHTMGPEGGYTQGDVDQAAYALTGWQFYAGPLSQGAKLPVKYGAYFFQQRHEPGTFKILGKSFKPKKDGANQAAEMVASLGALPQTAKWIAGKLARHFIADYPPQDAIDRIAGAFMDTGGDLVAVHTQVVEEVVALAPDNPKFTNPETWLGQAYKLTGVPVPTTLPDDDRHSIHFIARELGQPHDQCPQPNGWSDLKADWVSKEMLDRRIRFAWDLGLRGSDELAPMLGAYCDRLAGTDSALSASVKRAESKQLATMLTLSSPQFLSI